jgi:hypothetical protein
LLSEQESSLTTIRSVGIKREEGGDERLGVAVIEMYKCDDGCMQDKMKM